MKIAVIRNGNVGKAVFRELQSFREINELVLIGRNADACCAEADDYMDALPLRIDIPAKLSGGGYELAKDADILVYCAGPSIEAGCTDRKVIAESNIKVMKEVFDEVDKYAPNAIVISVTNPLDLITTAITKYTGRPAERVIGTGTLLDTSRLIKLISSTCRVSMEDVRGYVIGEHGNSSVVLLSTIRILGMTEREFMECSLEQMSHFEKVQLQESVRDAGFKIFRGKGYTSAGVAAAVALIVFDIVNDTHRIYPVSHVLNGEYGVDGFAISVPCRIGKKGVELVQKIKMTESEETEFRESARVVSDMCKDYDFTEGRINK